MLQILVCLWGVISLTTAIGDDLPPYIEECSLSDPNLSKCFKEKANLAVPFLVKGYKELDIPQIEPVIFPEAPCFLDGATIVLYDVYSDLFKNVVITDATFDLKRGKVEFDSVIDHAEVLAKNYTIVNGTIIGMKASGHGMFNMTFAKLTNSNPSISENIRKVGRIIWNWYTLR
ncbi:hemolymph juvenile hormone-binding protein [Oryctes borbonicus]|uniref:Hemolymph juvenile hormone-binding protein n=1 Tax=Oryctes borbonicus TaxID=1629725 RepID=A0A0T6BCB0_9SCAR|nr:hemolymph juvenile hormone-binding protein [Oryctes borbonicus]